MGPPVAVGFLQRALNALNRQGADYPDIAADGVLGAMAGTVGSFAVMHAIRIILAGHAAFGDPQWGKLHILDGLAPAMRSLKIAKDPECKGCSGGG